MVKYLYDVMKYGHVQVVQTQNKFIIQQQLAFQSQTTVTDYLKSKQLLLFDFERHPWSLQ